MIRAARAIAWPAVGLTLTAAAVCAQDWTVRTEVLDGAVVQGEAFRVCVTVTAQIEGFPTIEVAEPVWGDALLPTEASYQTQHWDRGAYEYSECWSVVADRAGPVSIPPVRVTLTRPGSTAPETRTTTELIVTVRQPSESQPDRGAAPPAAFPAAAAGPHPTPVQWWVIGGLAGTILLSATAAMAWLRHGEPAAGPTVLDPASPEARALSELAALRRGVGNPDLMPFYGGLATAVAGYVARRGGLGEAVLTSTEARAEIERQGAGRELRDVVFEALHAADEVRFARGTPRREQAEDLLARLQRLLDETGRRPV